MAASAIARSIESGNLLTDDHTLQFLRSEPRYRSPLLNRQTRQSWLDSGGHDMARNAVDKAAALLKTHQPEPLAAEMERELKDILGHASRELA
jgi:trimethylamine:corrinoid methyltransferase-like protein